MGLAALLIWHRFIKRRKEFRKFFLKKRTSAGKPLLFGGCFFIRDKEVNGGKKKCQY